MASTPSWAAGLSATSDRPYRDAWPRADVVNYVAENSGSIFDPRVAEAFLGMVEESG